MKRSKSKPDALSAADAELLARLQAMPAPLWMAALASYQTHTQRMTEWYRELDRLPDPMSSSNAELLTRLEALPAPRWLAPMLAYKSHAERMRAWYRELDKTAKPLIWRLIDAERAELLASFCTDCHGPCKGSHRRKKHKLEWPEKRRTEVQTAAAARGDVFPELRQAS